MPGFWLRRFLRHDMRSRTRKTSMPSLLSPISASDRLRTLLSSRRTQYVFLAILFLVNILWFHSLGYHVIMGDDLLLWNQVASFSSPASAFSHILDGSKYRPVTDLCHYLLFALFSFDYRGFFYFNILFNFIVINALFMLIKEVTHNDTLLAFGLCLVYILALFSYYNILQVYGILEALSLLLLISIIRCVVRFIRTAALKWAVGASILYFLLVMTHERYLVLLPFLLLAFVLFDKSPGYRRKRNLLIMAGMPFLLNYVLKRFVFSIPFITRTSTMPLELNIFTVLSNMGLGLLKIAGVNNGPAYLNQIPFSEQDPVVRIIGILIATIIALFVFFAFRRSAQLSHDERLNKFKQYLTAAALLFGLLFSASISGIQEQRWLYSSYVVVLISISCILSDSRVVRSTAIKYSIFGLLIVLIVHNALYYRRFHTNLGFVYANRIADSFYDVTVKKYGTNIASNRIVVEKFRDYQWILQDSLFFRPYIPYKKVKITFVDSIEKVSPGDWENDKVLIYRLNWSNFQMIDMKNPDLPEPLVLKKFGPDRVRAGQVFNRQANGESAIWADTQNASQSTVFVLNETELETRISADGKSAAAEVQRYLYKEPGVYNLFLLDKKTHKKSNIEEFIVEP
jgi:hypothetical protein